jgi:SET domain-containing protein
MKTKLFQNDIYVKKSKLHGYGVFANKDIKKGERIEECYMLVSKGGDEVLEDFYFDVKRGRYAMLTGYGCIYNHAVDPNADYTFSVKDKIFVFKAERLIRKGEEIFVSYGDEWFSDRNIKLKAL